VLFTFVYSFAINSIYITGFKVMTATQQSGFVIECIYFRKWHNELLPARQVYLTSIYSLHYVSHLAI
jgi:hypothetical protein